MGLYIAEQFGDEVCIGIKYTNFKKVVRESIVHSNTERHYGYTSKRFHNSS